MISVFLYIASFFWIFICPTNYTILFCSSIDKSNLDHFENRHKSSLPISHIWKRSTQWNNPLYYDTVWQTTVGEIQKLNITLSLTIFIKKIPHLIHPVVVLKSRQWLRSFFVKLISYGFKTSMNNIICSLY